MEAAKTRLPGIEVLLSDARNVAAIKALVDQVKAKHGHIDVLFINAGIAEFVPIAQIGEASTIASSTSTSKARSS